MKKIAPLAFLLSMGIACTVEVSYDDDLELLHTTVDQFNQAFETCDIQTLNELTTKNYTHTNSSSVAISKKEWMAYLKKRKAQLDQGQLTVTKYLLDEKQVSLYKNSAIVTGVILMDETRESIEFSRKIRVSNFWVKENGHWKRAGFHDTRIE